ncbi:hypothetical protein EV702DRAFT_1044805 [Suillus placidus]|uniref:Uncharacterized protein n=1 Tax=Suillus placidus TaxID=48579 RepID=A0A9P6ZWJ2_9AGAM|nr:hypothetical protein EV702DRAFT_1044805 [Suillus placidus]
MSECVLLLALTQGDCSAGKTHVHPRALLVKDLYTPTSMLAIMHLSVLLTELAIVQGWFHESAPQLHHPDPSASCYAGSSTGSGGVVKELDPDAVNGGDGQLDLRKPRQALYPFICAGGLDEAVRQAHQSGELLQMGNKMMTALMTLRMPKDGRDNQVENCGNQHGQGC